MGIRSLNGQSSSTGASTSVDRGRFQADLGWDNTVLKDSFIENIVVTTSEASASNSTVVASAYDTIGNGGRKLVRLDNGWLISCLYNNSASNRYEFYKSTDNGSTWSSLCYYSINISSIAISSKGNTVYAILSANTGVYFFKFDATTVSGSLGTSATIETGQTAGSIGGMSLITNETGTELHATWHSKSSTYPNSFNIRYVKGTVDTDGVVTWGTVTQVTKITSINEYIQNPTIFVKDKNPFIVVESKGVGTQLRNSYHISIFSPTLIGGYIFGGTTSANSTYQDVSWGNELIYDGTSYSQSNPSAIFVPKSINSLSNGRIWVAWQGTDSTDTSYSNIRSSYSDDGGATWSTMQKLTTNGNANTLRDPSVTADKNNKVTIIYDGSATGMVRKIENMGNAWGTPVTVDSSNGLSSNPSALYDLSIEYDVPLFIYENSISSKVGFYGTWKTTKVVGEELNIGKPITTNTVSDVAVVTSAYDTSGNGGRKLVRLANGWLVSAVVNPSTSIVFMVSKDNGGTWAQLCYANLTYANGQVAISSVGTRVFAMFTHPTYTQILFVNFDAVTQTNIALTSTVMESGQSAFNGVTLAINDTGTELHATWSSKNTTYANSFNIRYAKGVINTDGSVTWGAVTQITTHNVSGRNGCINPSLVIANGKPVIIYVLDNGSNGQYNIECNYIKVDGSWVGMSPSYPLYNTAYAQSSPSAIFVPQSINGLTNGRIWVAWHGTDSTYSTVDNIRVSYSDDNGVTWSVPTLVSSTSSTAHQRNASITASKSNAVHILYETLGESGYSYGIVRKAKYTGSSWTRSNVTSGVLVNLINTSYLYPSALSDPTFDYTEPLFIYSNPRTPKVGFYGTWKDGIMSGTAIKTITPPDLRKWGNVKFTSATPTDTTIVCDILDYNTNNIVKSNIKSLDDISDISITNQKIKLRFTLTRNIESATSPTVQLPSVAWEGGKFVLDEVTGKKYKYKVSDGKLLMEEC